MHLKGKTAIVTGAGRGIGQAIALALAGEGCNVVISARSTAQVEQAVMEIEKAGARALGITLDLSREANCNALIERAQEAFGTVDILINNAATHHIQSFLNTTTDVWDETMDINLRAPFLLCRKALNAMKEKHAGYIINVSSAVAYGPANRVMAYSVSKYALRALSDTLYQEALPYNVKVSTVYPGIVATQMVEGADLPGSPEQWMQPEDIACCVLFLLKQSDRMLVRDIYPTNMM